MTGIGPHAWDRLFAKERPARPHPFKELHGSRHRAVATPGDLLFHIRAARQDLCFALATEIMSRLRGAVRVQDEAHGFQYFEERDLLGFADGTENPTGAQAQAAVVVGEEDPGFAGGSYAVVQKYLHDLNAWEALPVELRDNMPFGTVGTEEFGTYFIGYVRRPEITETMLDRMFPGTETVSHDRILDFSTAVTGALFFTPSADFLEDLPELPDSQPGRPTTVSHRPGPTGLQGETPRSQSSGTRSSCDQHR